MKTCLIYGHNGLDLDVAFNIRSFYKQLGFCVFFSDKLYDADLLIVLRAMDTEIDIAPFNFSIVHVYDYVGWDYDAFVRTIDHKISYIFCTSEIKRTRLIDLLHFPKEQVFVALPPVDIKLWSKKIEEVKYNIVHIGNFKPITEKDTIKELFNETISHFKTHVWGLGWQLDKDLYHGRTGIFSVSNIYANSKFALGLMYPFQRDVTFSGRFWHAPLNGCSVFSESGLYSIKIPGVIETDYSLEDIDKKIAKNIDRIALQNEAKNFWLKQNNATLALIVPTLKSIKRNEFNLKNALIFSYFSVNNILKEYYQKLSVFKLVQNK
jgi:hypothetical protein